MLCVIDLSLVLLNTSSVIYSILKESKYTADFLSINNETQCIPLLCLSSRLTTYTPSFTLVKLCFDKAQLNLGS